MSTVEESSVCNDEGLQTMREGWFFSLMKVSKCAYVALSSSVMK